MPPLQMPKTPGVTPPKPPAVPKAGSPGWKAFTEQRWASNHPNAGRTPAAPKQPAATPTSTAMTAFRTALDQLKASTPPVDQAAIYAPYRASEAVTGQLGQGLQSSLLQSGQAAQDQYAKAQATAQQSAAQFGIGSGGTAARTAIQNTGAAPLAQQTNAYAAAAPQAAAQWQQLLERSAAAKVAGANTDRNNLIAQGSANLSTALPTAIGNEQDRIFRQQTQRQNIALARTQLTEKQNEAYNRDVLGQQSITSREQTAAANRRATNQRSANSIAATNQRSANSIAATNQRALQARSKAATNKGLKGIPQALKALQGGTSSASSKAVTGYNISIVPGPNSVDAGAPQRTVYAKDPAVVKIPTGWQKVGDPKPVTGPATTTKTTTSITPAQWDAQMRGLLAQNPGQTAAIKAFLGPRPKASKK